jgi:hypothetical protein
MRGNRGVEEGFRRIKYPDTRKGRAPLNYSHVNDPIGRVWLLFILFECEKMTAHSDANIIDRDHKGAGISKDALKRAIDLRCPSYPDYYLEKTGRTLRANIYYLRWYNKVPYTNGKKGKGGTPAQSREHYTASSNLRPLVPTVEAVFRSGEILTLEKMKKLGTLP